MERVTDREQGLFPKPKEIKMRCSCPDYAGMCEHIAATMYGIGSRLDSSPELLFVIRGVDHKELIEQSIPKAPVRPRSSAPTISPDDLGDIFDIEIGEAPIRVMESRARARPASKNVATKAGIVKKAATTRKRTKQVPKKGSIRKVFTSNSQGHCEPRPRA